MLSLIKELSSKRKVTVVLSTHLLPDVEQVCDRVIMINKGKVVLDGPLESFTVARDGCYEIRVRDNQGEFIEAIERAGFAWERRQTGDLLVRQTAETASGETLFEAAKSAQTQIRHFRPVHHTLEETFVRTLAAEASCDPGNGE
jgi:ABC-2 type transport system ATP-binding protein